MSLPETIEIANLYVANELDSSKVALAIGLSHKETVDILNKPGVKDYIKHLLSEIGYANSLKLGNLLDEMIENKVEEARETGIFTNKDLADLIKLRMDMNKESSPRQQTNVQVNNNYSTMMETLLKPRDVN